MARQFTVHVAETDLSKPIDAALAGEGNALVKHGEPAVRLETLGRGRFEVGLLKGQLAGSAPDFFVPMHQQQLELWEGGH
jgi:antitoxin (DNA-binding transcriptional repressor) of toxin-antitoxin stability system